MRPEAGVKVEMALEVCFQAERILLNRYQKTSLLSNDLKACACRRPVRLRAAFFLSLSIKLDKLIECV